MSGGSLHETDYCDSQPRPGSCGLFAVEVAVEAALTLHAPPVILTDAAAMRVNLSSAAASPLLPLHVAEEGSLPRRVVEGGGARLGVAGGLLGGHGQVLRAHLLVPTRGAYILVGVQDHCTANPHQVTRGVFIHYILIKQRISLHYALKTSLEP